MVLSNLSRFPNSDSVLKGARLIEFMGEYLMAMPSLRNLFALIVIYWGHRSYFTISRLIRFDILSTFSQIKKIINDFNSLFITLDTLAILKIIYHCSDFIAVGTMKQLRDGV